MSLRISRDLALPLDVAGEAIAILAKRGAGKTNTATVLVEELHAAAVQVVVLDPVGSWWGLRSSADGKGEGLPIARLGGEHGDVPLEQTAGALVADVAVDSGEPLLLDLSDFPSKAAIARFTTDFAERLYRRKARARSLLHLVLEEADEFAPQKVRADVARMTGAVEQIVRRGRGRGLGITMVTQRSAVLNKDVLEQTDVLIAMRTTGPNDRKAIERWVEGPKGDEGGAEIIDSLASLETGEAWVWNPERDLRARVKIRRRRTFDSSSTPKAGERKVEPRKQAAIDLNALGEQIQATAKRAEASDPRKLQGEIRRLNAELAKRPTEERVVEVEKVVEKPVLNGQVEDLHHAVAAMRELAGNLSGVADRLLTGAETIARAVAAVGAGRTERVSPAVQPPRRREQAEAVVRAPARRPAPTVDVDVKLGKGERTVLDVLAEYPEGRTYNEVAFLAGYSAKASTLGVILSNLRKGGLVEPGNQPVRPTPEGLAAAGGPRSRPTGQALLDQWMRHPRMGEGERRVLSALIGLYPEEPTHEELCEQTGYSPSASTMGVLLSKLRKLGLVEKRARRVADEFMEAISEEPA